MRRRKEDNIHDKYGTFWRNYKGDYYCTRLQVYSENRFMAF